MYQVEETEAKEVPDHVKHLYKEVDGKFIADEPHHGVLENLRNLTKGLAEAGKVKKSANEEAQSARATLNEFKGLLKQLDLDPEDREKLTAQLAEIKEKISKGDAGKINWDKVRAEMEKGHKAALEERDGKVVKMTKTLERHLIDKEAVSAIAAAKGEPDLLLPHIRGQVKVVEDGDDFKVIVVDKDGDQRTNPKGGTMTIADLVAELKGSKTFGRAFDGEGTSGSGTGTGTKHSPSTAKQMAKDGLTANDKIKAGLAQRNRR